MPSIAIKQCYTMLHPQNWFKILASMQAAATLGSAVGVSMGAAIGIAVGVGVGLATAIGVSVAIGTAGFVVPNAQALSGLGFMDDGWIGGLDWLDTRILIIKWTHTCIHIHTHIYIYIYIKWWDTIMSYPQCRFIKITEMDWWMGWLAHEAGENCNAIMPWKSTLV